MIRILTKNGVENTNIDGARDHNFNANGISGISRGVLNEAQIFSDSSNTIAIDTCELRMLGHRIVSDEIVYKTLTSTPASATRYSIVAQIIMKEQDPSFEFIIVEAGTALHTDDINSGDGLYEIEIGQFTHNTDGTISDVVRTASVFYPMEGSYLNIKADKVSNATNGNFAGLDENGNLTDSGKNQNDFVERKTTQGTYVYFHNGATQGEMEVKSAITPSDNEIPTSNGVINMVNTLIADKQDKINIEVPAHVNADINLTLENNKQFRYGVLYGAINISFPSNPALDFMCELDIQSMPSMSYPNNIKWSGDDIENGIFVPDSQALTPYQILFYTSGVSNNIWNGIVRKPSV